MSYIKDKKNKIRKKQSKSNIQNDSEDVVTREPLREERRIRKQREIPEDFRQYIDEMHDYYQQQQAYLQDLNAQCFQQLFHMVYQGQQKQVLSNGLQAHNMDRPQNQFTFTPNYVSEPNANNNNCQEYPTPAPQQHRQGYSYPLPRNEEVLHQDVVNRTRIKISESPPVANKTPLRKNHNTSSFDPRDETPSPVLQLNLTKRQGIERPVLLSHQDRPGRMGDESQGRRDDSEEEPMPQINLYITVIPPSASTAEQPSTQQSSVHLNTQAATEGPGPSLHRRRTVRDALRERMRVRNAFKPTK